MAITANIEFFRGEDVVIEVTLTPVTDIAGFTFKATIGSISKTTDSGISITDAGAGVLQIVLSDTDTESLSLGRTAWALKRSDAGKESVLTIGECVVKETPVI